MVGQGNQEFPGGLVIQVQELAAGLDRVFQDILDRVFQDILVLVLVVGQGKVVGQDLGVFLAGLVSVDILVILAFQDFQE